jgi:hypothetical protein
MNNEATTGAQINIAERTARRFIEQAKERGYQAIVNRGGRIYFEKRVPLDSNHSEAASLDTDIAVGMVIDAMCRRADFWDLVDPFEDDD